MAQVQLGQRKSTSPANGLPLAEWMAFYDRQPIEVVNGEIVAMNPVSVQHILIAHALHKSLDKFVDANHLGVVLFETPYVLDRVKRKNWVLGSRVPDISFLAAGRLEANIAEHGVKGPLLLAPDLAIEIISPNDKADEVAQKIADYLRCGVRLVWLVDPEARAVRVVTPENPDGLTLGEQDALTGDPVLPGWKISIKALLGAQG